eukprot:comp22383_c0_seq1/m.54298 comp22383_c0_seq1/g.54298  ORF comp22383_c0_seq1/g.54298 comp22383_c0_seq1/m.54298 type:complete len:598 (+) comp22383_c0_seq1:1254-3047(+)
MHRAFHSHDGKHGAIENRNRSVGEYTDALCGLLVRPSTLTITGTAAAKSVMSDTALVGATHVIRLTDTHFGDVHARPDTTTDTLFAPDCASLSKLPEIVSVTPPAGANTRGFRSAIDGTSRTYENKPADLRVAVHTSTATGPTGRVDTPLRTAPVTQMTCDALTHVRDAQFTPATATDLSPLFVAAIFAPDIVTAVPPDREPCDGENTIATLPGTELDPANEKIAALLPSPAFVETTTVAGPPVPDDDDDDDDNEPEDKFPGADDSDSGSSEGEGEGEESQLAVKNSYADAATTVPRDDNESVFVQSQSRSCWAAVAYNLNMWREKTLRWDKGGPGTRGYFRYYVAGAQDCQAMSKLDQCDSTGPNLQQYCLSNPAAGATKAVMDKVVRALQMKSAAYSETKNWTPQQWKSHVSNFGPHLVTVWTSLPSQGPHVAILESVYVPASKPEAAQFYIADVNSGAAGVQADGSRVLSFADFKEEQKKAYDRTSQLETPMDLGAAWFPNPVPKLTCDDPPDTCDCETNEQGLYLKGRSGSEDVCDDWGARNGKADGFAWCYVSKKCAIGKIGSFEGRRWRKCKPGYNGGFVQEKAHGLKVFS